MTTDRRSWLDGLHTGSVVTARWRLGDVERSWVDLVERRTSRAIYLVGDDAAYSARTGVRHEQPGGCVEQPRRWIDT